LPVFGEGCGLTHSRQGEYECFHYSPGWSRTRTIEYQNYEILSAHPLPETDGGEFRIGLRVGTSVRPAGGENPAAEGNFKLLFQRD